MNPIFMSIIFLFLYVNSASAIETYENSRAMLSPKEEISLGQQLLSRLQAAGPVAQELGAWVTEYSGNFEGRACTVRIMVENVTQPHHLYLSVQLSLEQKFVPFEVWLSKREDTVRFQGSYRAVEEVNQPTQFYRKLATR